MRPQSIIVFLVLYAHHVRGYDDKPTIDFGRLPDDTSPEWYALNLVPDFNATEPSFAGRVDISILVKTTTSEITLNSKDLMLHEIRITDDDTNGDVRVDSWKYVEDLERVKVKVVGHILAKRKYKIHIDYSGYLNDDASNIFHTSYDAYQRVKKWIAANKQFKTTRARSAFPCYDEPHQRFLSGYTKSNDESKWFIRLSYTTNKEKNFDTKSAPTVWLNPSVNETVIPIDDDVEWYIFNIQSTGFYRVNYTEENWLSLIKQLNDSFEEIHVLNRAQLIDDSFNLAKAGLLNYKIPMSFTDYLQKENDIIPWFTAMNSLNFVLNRMRRFRNALVDVEAFVSKLAYTAFEMINKLIAEQKSPQYPTNIGWNTLSTWACKLDNYIMYQSTTVPEYYRRWKNGEEIPSDIKDAAFCVGVRHSQVSESFDKLLHLYNTTKTYSERASVINALPCADIQTLLTFLTLIMEEKFPIEPSDYEDFFNAMSSTTNGIIAMNYFITNFTDLVNNVKDGKNIATTIFSILFSKITTIDEINHIMTTIYESKIPCEYSKTLIPVFQSEVIDNQKWYDNGGPEAIWEYINPLSKTVPLNPSEQNTTPQSTSEDDSNASSRLHNYAIIVQILALSVSVKLFVNII
ncbi:PREDICTED: aminopeptidase N-like [Diuraphis noxia]|uniref:aminopeptidase N-like n=1 Tax=Diuraphis noxia TaxID=143948 RepID=UPI0007639000|nr:PREDICTED: aminopeptidase N-like [Diuraphis noxia]